MYIVYLKEAGNNGMHGYGVFTWKWGTAVCMYILKELKLLYIGRIIEKRIFKRNNEIKGQGAGLKVHGVNTVFKKRKGRGAGKGNVFCRRKKK